MGRLHLLRKLPRGRNLLHRDRQSKRKTGRKWISQGASQVGMLGTILLRGRLLEENNSGVARGAGYRSWRLGGCLAFHL